MASRILAIFAFGTVLGAAGGSIAQIEFVMVGQDEEVREGLDQFASDANRLPPDCSIAVGDGVLITTTNRTIAIYDLANLQDSPETKHLLQFFAFEEPPNDDVFDAKVVFDPHDGADGRFVVTAMGPDPAGVADGNFLHVAYSNGSGVDFGSDWYFQSFGLRQDPFYCADPSDPQILSADQPRLGFDHRGWYASGILFGLPGLQGDRWTAGFYTIEKTDADEAPVTELFARDFVDAQDNELGCFDPDDPNDPQGAEIPTVAAHRDGAAPAVYAVGMGFGGGTPCLDPNDASILRIYAIGDPLDEISDPPGSGGTPPSSYEPEYYELSVDCFDWRERKVPTPAGLTPGAIDGRTANAVWRRIGNEEFLYTVHAVNESVALPSGTYPKTMVRWYVIKTNNWPDGSGVPEIYRSGEIDGGTAGEGQDARPVHLFLPSLMVNDAGDVVIVMGRSSEVDGNPISIQATGRSHDDPDGEVFDLTEIKVSSSDGATTIPPVGETLRLGDYYDVALDEDGATFWVFGEYIDDNGTPMDTDDDFWATYIAHLKMPD